MKRSHVISIGVLAVGCASDPSSNDGPGSTTDGVPAACEQAGWDTSLAAFEALSEQAGDTYWYALLSWEYLHPISEASCIYRTTVEVVGGVLVRRTFELAEVAADTTADECTGIPFVEEGDAIGTMDGVFDSPAYTMQQMYAGCCDLLALEPADAYSFQFTVDDDGVVDECYALEMGCGESCEASVDGFRSFWFDGFGFGSPP
jgi:hypothetical protein